MRGIQCGLIFFMFVVSGLLSAAVQEQLVTSALLEQASLQSSWQVQLPLNRKEKLDRLFVFQGYLYALTDRNFFFCIDRATGAVRSMMQMANPELPIQPPLHYQDKSVFLIGQEVRVFNPASGVIERTVQLEHLGSNYGGIARNTQYIYVCGSDRRLYVFNAEKGVMTFMASADNDSVIYTVIASDQAVWFGTKAGNIVSMKADSAQKLWQYNLTGQMVVPLVKDGDYLYTGGIDTKVYKIRCDDGKPAWDKPFFAGDKIENPLIIGNSCVYVYAANSGLYAVDKQTGKAAWNLASGFSILAENGPLAYVYVKPGVMTVMDNNTGKEQVSINVAGISRFAVNTTDAAIYLANDNGQIQAAAVSVK